MDHSAYVKDDDNFEKVLDKLNQKDSLIIVTNSNSKVDDDFIKILPEKLDLIDRLNRTPEREKEKSGKKD